MANNFLCPNVGCVVHMWSMCVWEALLGAVGIVPAFHGSLWISAAAAATPHRPNRD